VRLGLVVEGEGRAPGTCDFDNLSTTTHPPQYRSFELDMQETSATEVCVSSFSFFLQEKGVRLGLVVEGEGRAPGTCACDDLSRTTHPLQHQSFELDMQETSATEVCEFSSSSCKLIQVWLFVHPF
jgi:hypothetical protein